MENNRILNLYEGDFNHVKKIIVGTMVMGVLEEIGDVPEEHFSNRGSTAVDAKFGTTLMIDICRQSRIPMILGSVDAAQCYDRVLHLFIVLMLLALLRNYLCALVYLCPMQLMKFFIRSGFGDSAAYYGGLASIFAWMGLGHKFGFPPNENSPNETFCVT